MSAAVETAGLAVSVSACCPVHEVAAPQVPFWQGPYPEANDCGGSRGGGGGAVVVVDAALVAAVDVAVVLAETVVVDRDAAMIIVDAKAVVVAVDVVLAVVALDGGLIALGPGSLPKKPRSSLRSCSGHGGCILQSSITGSSCNSRRSCNGSKVGMLTVPMLGRVDVGRIAMAEVSAIGEVAQQVVQSWHIVRRNP